MVLSTICKCPDGLKNHDIWMKYLVLFGLIIVQLSLGSIFSFGNLQIYMSSYLTTKNARMFDDNDVKIQYKHFTYYVSWIYSFCIISQSFGHIVGAKLCNIMGNARSVLFGCFISSTGLGLTYWGINKLYLCMITYGIIYGFGIGASYPGTVKSALSWWYIPGIICILL